MSNMSSTSTEQPTSPGLLRRFAAMVYDSLLLLAVIMAYGALVLVLKLLVQGPMADDGRVYEGYWGAVVFVGLIATIVAFFCYFWRRSGQTLGMRSWRMRLVDRQLQPPTLRQCLLRCLLASISLAALGLGYFWRWLDPKGYTLHDRFSGTQLVLLAKKQKP